MIVLDPPVQAGPVYVAAVCQISVDALPQGKGVGAWASKTPLAILFAQDGHVWVASPCGAEMTLQALEARAPGVTQQFRAETCPP